MIDVSGPLDARALGFMVRSIESAAEQGQVLALVQIDSRAVLDGAGYDSVIETLQDPPLPVAVWVGPAPAAALGGAQLIVEAVEHKAISPGSVWGVTNPVVLGEERTDTIGPSQALAAEGWGIELQPTIRQYLQDLNERTFRTADGPVEVITIEEFEGGVTLKPVTFRKPDLLTRTLRLAVMPEAAFFFLVAGLTIVSFELFALGPGVAAGVAGLSLLLGGWGLVNLPVNWWAVGLLILGWLLLTAALQRGGKLVLTLAGAVLLQISGMTMVGGTGQLEPTWWLVMLTVLAVLAFFLVAMPTMQRARLSTPTIGRDSLVGQRGTALVDFDPDGLVEVENATWRATAHREAGVAKGSQVVVTGINGLYLEVEPE